MTTNNSAGGPDAKEPTLRIVDRAALLIAGMGQRYGFREMKEIPALWQRFAPYIGKIPSQAGWTAYGVITPAGADSFDYLAGVEVAEAAGLPESMKHLAIPALRYAVFEHREHVSSLSATIEAIWQRWLPASGHQPIGGGSAPGMIERYGEGFNPQTGYGDMEVWVPVKA
jgi:AraC family transcriptional regulator